MLVMEISETKALVSKKFFASGGWHDPLHLRLSNWILAGFELYLIDRDLLIGFDLSTAKFVLAMFLSLRSQTLYVLVHRPVKDAASTMGR